MEVASTSSYQLQLQQLQAEEAAASAKAAADAKLAEMQAALDSLQEASPFVHGVRACRQELCSHIWASVVNCLWHMQRALLAGSSEMGHCAL